MHVGRTGAGFTLFEVLLVVVAIGLMGTMIVSGFTNVIPAGREVAAVNKARIVNAARLTYALTVPEAATAWAAASTDAERSNLLIQAGALSGATADWVGASGGYTLSFSGALRAKTILRDKSGTALNYTD